MLKFLKEQKLLLALSVLILCAMLIVDPILNMNNTPQSDLNQLPTLPKYDSEQVNKEAADKNVINKILAMFEVNDDKSAIETSKLDLMPDEEQQQQQGLLKQLYIGQKRYVLSAIIRDIANNQPKDKSYQAILNVFDAEQDSSKSIYVKQSDALADYLIIEITKNSLYLQQDQRKIELRLFQPTELN